MRHSLIAAGVVALILAAFPPRASAQTAIAPLVNTGPPAGTIPLPASGYKLKLTYLGASEPVCTDSSHSLETSGCPTPGIGTLTINGTNIGVAGSPCSSSSCTFGLTVTSGDVEAALGWTPCGGVTLTPGSYTAVNVTINAGGCITAISNGSGGASWIPLVSGSEPPTFITTGDGRLVLVAY